MKNKKMLIMAVVAMIVFGVVGFFGGTLYEKSKPSKSGATRNGNLPGADGQRRLGGAGGFAGARGGAVGENGGFVAGEIISKDDKSITIKTQDGGSKIIYFSDTTSIGKSVQGSVLDLVNNDQVIVSGRASSDGTVTAQNIQIRPAQQ